METLEEIRNMDKVIEWKENNKKVFAFKDLTNKSFIVEVTVKKDNLHSYFIYELDSINNGIGKLCSGGAFFSEPSKIELYLTKIYNSQNFLTVE